MLNRNFKNDAEAFQQMSDGNMAAYRFLFDHHFSDLCNFLMIYLHSRELSEEIALEIFTYIWEKRRTLQIRTTFKSFLFSSAKNKAISLYRIYGGKSGFSSAYINYIYQRIFLLFQT